MEQYGSSLRMLFCYAYKSRCTTSSIAPFDFLDLNRISKHPGANGAERGGEISKNAKCGISEKERSTNTNKIHYFMILYLFLNQ